MAYGYGPPQGYGPPPPKRSNMWIWFLVGGAFLVLVTAAAAITMSSRAGTTLVTTGTPPVTQECPTAERFAALQEGMTRDQVEAVMGQKGLVASETPQTVFLNFVCLNPKRRITVVISGGVLTSKTSSGI